MGAAAVCAGDGTDHPVPRAELHPTRLAGLGIPFIAPRDGAVGAVAHVTRQVPAALRPFSIPALLGRLLVSAEIEAPPATKPTSPQAVDREPEHELEERMGAGHGAATIRGRRWCRSR